MKLYAFSASASKNVTAAVNIHKMSQAFLTGKTLITLSM